MLYYFLAVLIAGLFIVGYGVLVYRKANIIYWQKIYSIMLLLTGLSIILYSFILII